MNNIYVIPRYHSHECPTIHHAIHSAFRGPICNVMGIPIQNISIVLLPLCYMSVIMWCTYCVHVTQWCRSCATPRCTLTPRVICMFVCVCVYVVNESTTPCNAKNFTARFLDSGFTFRIQIDTHWSKPYLRGRPHASFWSVCTLGDPEAHCRWGCYGSGLPCIEYKVWCVNWNCVSFLEITKSARRHQSVGPTEFTPFPPPLNRACTRVPSTACNNTPCWTHR